LAHAVHAIARTDATPIRLSHQGIPATRMQRFWSLAVATGGNQWQMRRPRKRL
jgi:hypothetical protein